MVVSDENTKNGDIVRSTATRDMRSRTDIINSGNNSSTYLLCRPYTSSTTIY